MHACREQGVGMGVAVVVLVVALTLAVSASTQATCVWALEEEVGPSEHDAMETTTQIWVRWEDDPAADTSDKTRSRGMAQDDDDANVPRSQMRRQIVATKGEAGKSGTLARTLDRLPNVEGVCAGLAIMAMVLLVGAIRTRRRTEG